MPDRWSNSGDAQQFPASIRRLWRQFTLPFIPGEWRKGYFALPADLAIRGLALGLFGLVAFYLLLAPAVSMPMYNKLIFHPELEGGPSIDALVGVPKQDVFFQAADGARLHAWYFRIPGSRNTVLLSHGNGGDVGIRAPIIEMLLRGGFSVLAYDYEGYGRSEGSPTVDKVCDDGLAAYDYLVREQHLAPKSIILYGESLGGGITCHIARHRGCAAIVLQSTFYSLPHVAGQHISWLKLYPRFLYPSNTLDNLEALRGSHAPVLIMHGTKDQIVPFDEAQLLYSQASQPKHFVGLPDVGHNDIYDNPDDWSKVMLAFLKPILGT